MKAKNNLGLFEKRESKILDINSNTKLESFSVSIFESIENSKQTARIQMDRAILRTEKEYWCGIIGGLQIARQHLEKEFDV